ncbi:hypothetical protein U1Q18_043572, partial [Sarracenia purpurea var. burkii]
VSGGASSDELELKPSSASCYLLDPSEMPSRDRNSKLMWKQWLIIKQPTPISSYDVVIKDAVKIKSSQTSIPPIKPVLLGSGNISSNCEKSWLTLVKPRAFVF